MLKSLEIELYAGGHGDSAGATKSMCSLSMGGVVVVDRSGEAEACSSMSIFPSSVLDFRRAVPHALLLTSVIASCASAIHMYLSESTSAITSKSEDELVAVQKAKGCAEKGEATKRSAASNFPKMVERRTLEEARIAV